MRFLITTPVLPPELGGPATFVPRFASYLHERGHGVRVLSFGDEPRAVPHYPFPVALVRRTALPLRFGAFFAECVRLAAQSDLVFVCEHPALPSLMAAKSRGKPVVLRMMVNTAWELSYRFGLTRLDPDRFLDSADGGVVLKTIKRIEGLALRRADLVVAVSQHLGETAVRLGVPRERLLVSYNLPPAAEPSPADAAAPVRDRLAIPSDAFVLLIVARLVDWKGVDTVLSVVAALPSRLHLVIVGEGPMQEHLIALTRRLGLGDRVKFTGRVDNETVRQYMRAADLLILNSLYEGLSHVLLEAMDSGLAAVASDVPGNRELVEHTDNGILVQPNDADGLRQWIETLSASPDVLQRLGRRGRERAEEIRCLYSFERLTARLEELATATPPPGRGRA